jgi:hypothetical protein
MPMRRTTAHRADERVAIEAAAAPRSRFERTCPRICKESLA